MRRRSVPIALILILGLAGCSGNSLSGFAFGKVKEEPAVDPNLFPAHYKPEIAAFMRTYLNNPTQVRDAFIGEPALRTIAGEQRYVTCVRYNPRDSNNRYEGQRQSVALFLRGSLNQFLPDDPKLCTGLTYQRYPEIESMVP